MRIAVAALLAVALAGCGEPKLLGPGDLEKPALPTPPTRIAYGPGASQYVEQWRVMGRGRRASPLVILIHGGCWQSEYGADLMHGMANALKQEGYRVYNIEYRRLGEPGGGYPGTFQDVAAAVEKIASLENNLSRLVLVGHSAGGHLALWVSARPVLPETSPLYSENPTPIPAVLSLGGAGDLEAAAADPAFSGACGKETIAQLVGAGTRDSDPYADTSPARLPIPGVRQLMMHGEREQVAPPALGEAYAVKVSEEGAEARFIPVPDAGHFEVISPGSPGWSKVLQELDTLTRNMS
jgi:acetyl esterase/lipase